MREKILKVFIYIFGIICLYAFISIRYLPVYNLTLKENLIPGYWDKTEYGELYYFNYITHFREKNMPAVNEKFQDTKEQASLTKAKIFTFGDSFFDIARGTQFAKRLKEKTNMEIHNVYGDYPLEYFLEHNYQKNGCKLLILGETERYIPFKFSTAHSLSYATDPRSETRKRIAEIRDKIFYQRSEEFYDVLLKRSYITGDIYSFIATAKFDLFKYISNLTPVYSLEHNTPWLFYHDQVNDESSSYYYHHTLEEIEQICDNLADLDKKLQDKFNIKLVFFPIPAKYTLYHWIVNNNDDVYNNFLPRLYRELEKRDVSCIKIYDDFINSDEILYYGTDSHWKVTGIDMAVEKTITHIKYDSTLTRFINQDKIIIQ